MAEQRLPRNLIEAIRYFADEDVAVEYVAKLRWTDGPVCPQCDGRSHSYLSTRRVWKCRECKKQFSVKVGTIFEDSPIKLGVWLAAIWMIANSKNGVSSHEMARMIGVTQKTAWFMGHRIRLAMESGSFDKFTGETEADETFIGGKSANMHKKVRKTKITGRGGTGGGKTIVAGVLQRNRPGQVSQVRAAIIPHARRTTLQPFVRQHVEQGAALYTDSSNGYDGLAEFKRGRVDHNAGEYVNERAYTNGIENFWTLLKRGIIGTYVQVSPDHLPRYVEERAFTFNQRDLTDAARVRLVLRRSAGRRVTYKALTA